MGSSDRHHLVHGQWVDVLVGASLSVSIVGALGFIAVFIAGGNTQLEGLSIGLATLGLTLAIGLWSKHYLDAGDAVQDRPLLGSDEEDRAAVFDEVDRVERSVVSRRVLITLAGGAAAATGAAAVVPLRSLGSSPLAALRTTAWSDGRRLVDSSGTPVRVGDLGLDEVITVFPEGASDAEREDSQAMLVRVEPAALADRGRPADGGDEGPQGHLCFSKVCTHAGCPVGLYQADTHQLVCPCHQSLFDVTQEAKPVFGPATRPLPRLPLRVESGFVVAAGDFPVPVGPGFWSLDAGGAPKRERRGG